MSDIPSLTIAIPALLLAGAVAGFAGGLFGIGGGFVVVPALVLLLPYLGVDPQQAAHLAIGTSLATIIFTSIRSAESHSRRGSVDFSVLRSWAIWVVLGTAGGAFIADYVTGGQLALIFAIGVLCFAIYFLLPAKAQKPVLSSLPTGAVRAGFAGSLGAFSALLGIGGGTLTTLVMTLSGTPIHRAIGTAAGMGAIIAIPGAIGFAIIGWNQPGLPWGSVGYVSVPAALVIVATSVMFAPLGVAAAHKLKPAALRRVFGLYLIAVGAMMIVRY